MDMSATALIVEVPEAELMVRDLREEFDRVSLLGMPAHITVLYPFLEQSNIDESQLELMQSVFDGFGNFGFQLNEVGEFQETVYLSPSPKERFTDLTKAIERMFPEYPPFGGIHDSIIPHLSVLNGSTEHISKVRKELEIRLKMTGPIESICNEVILLEFANHKWRKLDVFALN